MASTTSPLTSAEKEFIFRQATRVLPRRFADQIKSGMSDQELAAALESILGISGGSGGPDRLSIAYVGAGLRIWGSRSIVNIVRDKPIFAGKVTIAMARQTYGIANPEEPQLSLF